MVHSLKITCEVFRNNGNIPSRYTCDGENINPALIISNLPLKTKSLVVIMENQEAPKGVFTHWLAWNMPPTNKIGENHPIREIGINDFRKRGYSGPCPPVGTHRYHYKVWALDNFLHLNTKSRRAELELAMTKHIVGFGEVVGFYQRKMQ